MKILVVSDTHGNHSNLKKVLEKEGPLDGMIHLGDSETTADALRKLARCPVYLVAGNCDSSIKQPITRVEELDGCRIMMTHGHKYFVSVGTRDLQEAARASGCQVLMFGHTHRPFIDESDPTLTVLNPGSLTHPRQAGRRPSYILMETHPGLRPVFTLKMLEDSYT